MQDFACSVNADYTELLNITYNHVMPKVLYNPAIFITSQTAILL